jgi:transcriptional regulator with XRE-family HTH domain
MQLRGHRESMKLTVDDVAAHLDTAPRTVHRWEAGKSIPGLAVLRVLLDHYGVTDPLARMELETLRAEGKAPGWWTPYSSDVRPTFATFLGLEVDALSLMEYSAILVPGLLQTEAYMRAVMSKAVPRLSDEAIDKRVGVRLERQLDKFSRQTLRHFVIDESILWRRVGGVDTMREQLAHLLDLAKSRLITIQVLPLAVGEFASVLGNFSVLTFERLDDPPVACIELLRGDLYADGTDSELYTQHFDKLREAALPERLSLRLVSKIMKETHHAE